MSHQRVLLLETDRVLETVLCDVFADDGLEVSLCSSLADIHALLKDYPLAAVVSDSWTPGEYQTLSAGHRAEILALGATAQVVLTTGADWARRIRAGDLGSVVIVEKPYSMDELLDAVRGALARAANASVTRQTTRSPG